MISKNKSVRHPWVIWALATLLLVLSQFSSDIYLPSMPGMSEMLAVPKGWIQFASIISMVSFGLSLLVWGPLSDYYGRRPVALWGLGIFLIGSFLCAIAQDIQMIWLGRAFQGAGIGCCGAITPTIPKDIFTGPTLLKAFAGISMVLGVVPILAQVLGGYFQSEMGWRMNFIFLFVAALIIAFSIWMWLPETNPYCRQRPIYFKQLMVDYATILVDKPFIGYVTCMTLVYAGEVAYSIVTPFVLQGEMGLTPIENGGLSLFTGGGLLLGAFLSAQCSRWLNVNQLIQVGFAFLLLSALVMLTVSWSNGLHTWGIVGPMVLFMMGAGLVYPNCIAGIMQRFEQKAGIAGALMSGLQMAGAGLLNSVVAHWHMGSVGPLAQFLFALVLISIIVQLLWIERPR